MNVDGNLLARSELLLALAEPGAEPSYSQLQRELGLSCKQAVERHVRSLEEQGLVVRVGAVQLTPAGRVAANYIRAAVRGQTLWRYYLKRFFVAYSYAAAHAVEREADASDLRYTWGRKASAAAIVRALKRTHRLEDAAALIGLQVGALHQRITRLFVSARKEFDCRAPHEQAETTEELRTG